MLRNVMLNILLISLSFPVINSHESIPSISEKELSSFLHSLPSDTVYPVKYPNKGLGLILKKPIQAGAIALCINSSLIIYPNDPFPLSSRITHLSNVKKLVIRLLYEKFLGPKGNFYNNYIQSLPVDVIHPGHWSKSQTEYLDRINIIPMEDDIYCFKMFQEVYSILSSVEGVPIDMLKFQSLLWAKFNVMSRAFWYANSQNQLTPVMIPLLDLANHYPNPSKYRDQNNFIFENTQACLRTHWDLEAGDEFLYEYRKLSSAEWLVNYGTVIPNNPYDFFSMKFEDAATIDPQGYKLYADKINNELLGIYSRGTGDEIFIEGDIAGYLRKNPDHADRVLKALIIYRKNLKRYNWMGKAGVRELRRSGRRFQDRIMVLIRDYGIATRLTVYNHLRSADKEILISLSKAIF